MRVYCNYNFQWTKTLYQNSFNHIAFFFTLFEGYKCNKLYEIRCNCKEKVLMRAQENKLQKLQISQNEILRMTILTFLINFVTQLL